MLRPPYPKPLRVWGRADFLNWTFQFWSYEHQIFLWDVQTYSKLLSRGFFHILRKNLENRFFRRKLLFFQSSLWALIFKKNWLTWFSHWKWQYCSLRLIKNILFCRSYDLTFFRAYSCWCIWNFQYVSWCHMIDEKSRN